MEASARVVLGGTVLSLVANLVVGCTPDNGANRTPDPNTQTHPAMVATGSLTPLPIQPTIVAPTRVFSPTLGASPTPTSMATPYPFSPPPPVIRQFHQPEPTILSWLGGHYPVILSNSKERAAQICGLQPIIYGDPASMSKDGIGMIGTGFLAKSTTSDNIYFMTVRHAIEPFYGASRDPVLYLHGIGSTQLLATDHFSQLGITDIVRMPLNIDPTSCEAFRLIPTTMEDLLRISVLRYHDRNGIGDDGSGFYSADFTGATFPIGDDVAAIFHTASLISHGNSGTPLFGVQPSSSNPGRYVIDGVRAIMDLVPSPKTIDRIRNTLAGAGVSRTLTYTGTYPGLDYATNVVIARLPINTESQ